MIEITNKGHSPLQIMVRSKDKVSGFTTLIVPGRGNKNNVKIIEDEEWTEQIGRLERLKMLTVKHLGFENLIKK